MEPHFYKRTARFSVLAVVLSLTAMAAPPSLAVDGVPDFHAGTDTGLFVWRTSGGSWEIRVTAASGDQRVAGVFETGERVRWHTRLSAEGDDVITAGERSVDFDLRTARWTVDGLIFGAGDGDVCLRTSTGTPIFLGRDATPASSPVDLTSSGACGQDEQEAAEETDLVVERKSKFDWEVRLATTDAPAAFDGRFEFTEPPVSHRQVSFEGGDWMSQPEPGTFDIHMEVWPGWHDGVDFEAVEFSGICLRSRGDREQVVSLLSKGQAEPLRVTTPVDLTNNGSCGPPADPFPPPTHGRKFNPGHYVVLTGRDDDASLAESVLDGVQGFVKRYHWRDLEPTPGNYDFSEIESDLALIASYGLQLIALIEDKTFTNHLPTPDYLRDKTMPNGAGGYTVVRWDPYVVARYKALLTELGRRFDANPRFEGIATGESALGLDEEVRAATGYTPEKYRDVLIEEFTHAAHALPNSRVFWFMNFLAEANWYMGEVARQVAHLGVVMGGPDVMPDKRPLQLHPYPFYDGAVGKMPLFGQVEPVCYHHPHADPHFPTTYWTPSELFEYARDELHVSYMFWVRWRWRIHPDSYNWWDAIPVIQENPSFNR